MAIDEYIYDISLNVSGDTPILLDTYNTGGEALDYFNKMLQDKEGVKDSFVGLQNIPLEDILGLSLNRTHYKWGKCVGSECVKRAAF